MKKIRIGRKIEFLIYILFISLIILLYVLFLIDIILKGVTTTKILKLLEITVYCFIMLIFMCFDQNITWFISIKNEKVYLSSPLKVIRVYFKQQLQIKYGIKAYTRSGTGIAYPCLIIGTVLPQKIFFNEWRRKNVYENYFLIVLDEKKLQTVIKWFEEQIQLPTLEEIRNLDFNGINGRCEIEKFYNLIAAYNKSLEIKNNKVDGNGI